MSEDAQPVSYQGVPKGVPLLSTSGQSFGVLEKVLEVPSEDLFDGLIAHTKHGRRFVDRDQVAEITTEYIKCDLDDEAAANLPKPEGTPVYEANAEAVEGHNFHAWVGRTFGRGGWKRDS